jgi:hypothetical protein
VTKSLHTDQGKGSGWRQRRALRAKAAALLAASTDVDGDQRFRVCFCGRAMKGDTVRVYRARDGSRARFAGLVACGSVWTCPVCCLAVAEHRREELSKGIIAWVRMKGRAHLLTLTCPHDADQSLTEVLDALQRARQRWRNSRTYKRLLGSGSLPDCKVAASLGFISSLEVTYSRTNGWHPHLHEIHLPLRALNNHEIAELKRAWVACLLKESLGAPAQTNDMLVHGLDVRGGEDAVNYILKYGREESWGISSELTRSHAKYARGTAHYKPFGLLDIGEPWADAAFVEFAKAMHGRRALVWSPRLRASLELGRELLEIELAEKPLPDEEPRGELTGEQWQVVVSRDAEEELHQYVCDCLVLANTAQRDLDEFVDYLRKRPPRCRVP